MASGKTSFCHIRYEARVLLKTVIVPEHRVVMENTLGAS